MAKTVVRHRRSSGKKWEFTIPLAIAVGLAPGLYTTIARWRYGGFYYALWTAMLAYTGIDLNARVWVPRDMMWGTVPLIIGALIHHYVGERMGVNNALKRSGVPLLRI